MNVETARTLEALILPPGSLILLGVAGVLLWQRLWGRLMVNFALIALYLLCTPYIANRLIQGLETYPALSPELARKAGAQAIIVLGGGRYEDAPEYGNDTVSEESLVRLRYAAYLARHTGLPVIPSGGSVMSKGPPLAQLAGQVLDQGYKIEVAAVEDKSQTTLENARFTAVLLDRLDLKRVLLVTHAWHMPRAMQVFQQAGVNAVAAPTAFASSPDAGEELLDWLPTAGSLQLSSFALHEYVGALWYKIRQ